MYRGFSNVSLYEVFTVDENSKGTRGHSCKLVKTRCTRDITKYFFRIKLSLILVPDQRSGSNSPKIASTRSHTYLRSHYIIFYGSRK